MQSKAGDLLYNSLHFDLLPPTPRLLHSVARPDAQLSPPPSSRAVTTRRHDAQRRSAAQARAEKHQKPLQLPSPASSSAFEESDASRGASRGGTEEDGGRRKTEEDSRKLGQKEGPWRSGDGWMFIIFVWGKGTNRLKGGGHRSHLDSSHGPDCTTHGLSGVKGPPMTRLIDTSSTLHQVEGVESATSLDLCSCMCTNQ